MSWGPELDEAELETNVSGTRWNGSALYRHLVELDAGITESSKKSQATRRIQNMLNNKYDANLDVDGILGPLTIKSINKFVPDARARLADQPNKTTAVQGKKNKEQGVAEASPNTLAGSFTPDLVNSKTWLASKLVKELDGDSAGDIYILGAWFGNMGIFLQKANIKFDRLIMVETQPRYRWLATARRLLEPLYKEGRLKLVQGRAEQIVYPNKRITVINTSVNDMSRAWLQRVPVGTLTVIQGRDNLEDPRVTTERAGAFYTKFPLRTTVYYGQRQLRDPETRYTRFMKIGYK